MPSTKRRRSPRGNDRSTHAAKREPREPPLSLELYRLLPAEIRQLVIDFACRASSCSDYLFATDVTTAWSLSLASRELNERARPSLYQDLVITRPSALYALHRTLEAHPERAKLTRRLHIGPLNALPKHWWPLTSAYAGGEGWSSAAGQHFGSPSTWLKTSLKEEQLPSGYAAGHAWDLRQALPGFREAAISHAIQVAQDYLGFDAHLEGLDSSTTKIATILEVQAALDWVLQRMRSMEEEDSTLKRLAQPGARVPVQCRSGNCKHYLSLNILDALQQRASSRQPWSLGGQRCHSCMALLRHLARPGALTDRFDHPLIFVRSGFDVMVMPALGHGHEDRDRRCDTLIMMDSPYVVDKKYEWPDLAALHEDSRKWERELCGDVPNGNAKRAQAIIDRNDMVIKTSSLARTLSLARSVIALMPSLEDISLTGYLEALFSRTKDVARLRRASFGPPPCFWDARLPLSGFDGLEKLHLCGVIIFKDEVLRITNDMPRLRVFQWTMAEEYPDWIRENVNIRNTLKLLLTRESRAELAEEESEDEDDPEDVDGSSELNFLDADASPAASQDNETHDSVINDALIIVKLHPPDVRAILSAAPSPTVREAWSEGRRGQIDQRRLMVQVNTRALKSRLRLWENGSSNDWENLYEEGRAWWKDVCS